MYNGIQDELNRMIVAELHSIDTKSRFQQSGYYDKYVLCSKCDNERISKWERYTSLLLFSGCSSVISSFNSAVGSDGIKSIIIKNIDYKNFKLCLLSILWRAHISQNKFFKNVDLKGNEIQIQQMLLNNDLKDETLYKISIVAIRNDEGLIRMVIEPTVAKIGNGYIAIFFINGMFYFIDLLPNSSFELFQNNFLKATVDYEILLLEGDQGKAFMTAFGLPLYMAENYFRS